MSARVADRWPGDVGRSWVPMPVALIEHAAALGLTDGDLRLVLVLEAQRRDETQVVISQERLGELCACSDRAVRRRVERLHELGYLTTERVPSPGGRWPCTVYRLDGLWAALADASDRRTPASAGQERPQDESVRVRRTPASGVRRTPASAVVKSTTERPTSERPHPPKNGKLTHSGDLSRFDRYDRAGGGR